MEPHDIKRILESELPNAQVTVSGDGRHFEATIISSAFEGLSLIERQRRVYQALGNKFQTGEIHALSIKAKTPEEIN
jgi:acid stress-induced BolA-like protein IbaG/YrbA